jgi:hypothetical protein
MTDGLLTLITLRGQLASRIKNTEGRQPKRINAIPNRSPDLGIPSRTNALWPSFRPFCHPIHHTRVQYSLHSRTEARAPVFRCLVYVNLDSTVIRQTVTSPSQEVCYENLILVRYFRWLGIRPIDVEDRTVHSSANLFCMVFKFGEREHSFVRFQTTFEPSPPWLIEVSSLNLGPVVFEPHSMYIWHISLAFFREYNMCYGISRKTVPNFSSVLIITRSCRHICFLKMWLELFMLQM